MNIVIVAPHALCIDGAPVRTCDLRAEYAARRMQAYLTRTLPRTATISLFLADTLRADIDLNRPLARHTEWRERVQEVINGAIERNQRVLVLDIHSFPDDASSFGLLGDRPPAVVLLELPNVHALSLPPMVKVIQASLINDIIVSALRSGADAFLWEFNENAERATDTVIDQIAEWLRAYLVAAQQRTLRSAARAASDAPAAVRTNACLCIGLRIGTFVCLAILFIWLIVQQQMIKALQHQLV